MKTGIELAVVEGHRNWIAAVAWAGSEKFVSCGQDNTIQCYEIKQKK